MYHNQPLHNNKKKKQHVTERERRNKGTFE